jgi:hypothetical protein
MDHELPIFTLKAGYELQRYEEIDRNPLKTGVFLLMNQLIPSKFINCFTPGIYEVYSPGSVAFRDKIAQKLITVIESQS